MKHNICEEVSLQKITYVNMKWKRVGYFGFGTKGHDSQKGDLYDARQSSEAWNWTETT